MNNKKYTLDEFKKKEASNKTKTNLDLISGGILGSCHCVKSYDSGTWEVVYCVYYQQ